MNLNTPDPSENLELVLINAIKHIDSSMVEQCLSAGATITPKVIHEFIQDYVSFPYDYRDRNIIFELLLIYESTLFFNDVTYMTQISTNRPFIKLIIKYGYDDSYPGSIEIFKRLIDHWYWLTDYDYSSIMYSFLDNGFKNHIQSVLVYCITNSNVACLQAFLEYGANFYSILYDVYQSVLVKINSRTSLNTMQFFLDNVYKIEMLGQPIFKYFLIGLIQWDTFVVPKDIYVHIFRLYMETDYAMTNHIQKLVHIS